MPKSIHTKIIYASWRTDGFHNAHSAFPLREDKTPAMPAHGIFDAHLATAQHPPCARHTKPCWWQRAVATPTRRHLRHQLRHDAFAPAIWQARLRAFDEHVAGLTARQCAVWFGRQVCAWLNVPYRILSWIVFPGQFCQLEPFDRALFDSETIRLVPQCVITEDHAILDGILCRHTGPSKPHGEAKAPIVVVGGNCMLWEHVEDWLTTLAEQTARDVLMFNWRGMGTSIGGPCTTNTAIQDTRAALLRAQAMAPDAPLSVVGISIGGGCSAAAIASLRKSQSLRPTSPAQWIGIHTFASLPSVVGAHAGIIAKHLAQATFGLLGLDRFDTRQTLTSSPMAQQMTVLNARDDDIIPAAAALRFDPLWPDTWPGRVYQADVEDNAGDIHCDLENVFDAGTWVAQLRDA